MREGAHSLDLARRFRDSVGHRVSVVEPRLLQRMQDAARRAIAATGDPAALASFRSQAAQFGRYAARLSQMAEEGGRVPFGMRRPALRVADRIVRAVRRGNEEAVTRAVDYWAGRKQAYHQRVIARTETARAYSDAYQANASAVPWVIGFQWNLEAGVSRKRDICDVYASQNLYKLGPGVYPVGRLPGGGPPAHPNCMCFVSDHVDDAIGVDDVRPPAPPRQADASGRWLRSQPAAIQREILGPGAYGRFRDDRALPSIYRPS
jgi:hypothetical protein